MQGKIIIVTGGSGLLGKTIISHLLKKSCIVYNLDLIVDDKNKYDISCDVTNEQSIENAVNKIFGIHNRIDGLVNNAYPRTSDWGVSFLNSNMDSWSKNIDMQLNGYVKVIHKILPFFIKQRNGVIISMSSIYGVVGNDFSIYEGTNINPVTAYAAIKGGVIALTRNLAAQFGVYNIRFNCVSPGGIYDNQDPHFVRKYEEKVPLKRMGTPDDIAPSVVFLLSDDAKYITGHNLLVDGGWTTI